MAAKRKGRPAKLDGKADTAKKSRLFSETKVYRVLERLGVDPAKFRTEYDSDSTRGPRGSRPLEQDDIAAIQAYFTHRNRDTLASQLGVSKQSIDKKIAQYALIHFKPGGGA